MFLGKARQEILARPTVHDLCSSQVLTRKDSEKALKLLHPRCSVMLTAYSVMLAGSSAQCRVEVEGVMPTWQ